MFQQNKSTPLWCGSTAPPASEGLSLSNPVGDKVQDKPQFENKQGCQ